MTPICFNVRSGLIVRQEIYLVPHPPTALERFLSIVLRTRKKTDHEDRVPEALQANAVVIARTKLTDAQDATRIRP